MGCMTGIGQVILQWSRRLESLLQLPRALQWIISWGLGEHKHLPEALCDPSVTTRQTCGCCKWVPPSSYGATVHRATWIQFSRRLQWLRCPHSPHFHALCRIWSHGRFAQVCRGVWKSDGERNYSFLHRCFLFSNHWFGSTLQRPWPWDSFRKPLETHPKATPCKIEFEFCVVMGLQ